MIRGPELLLQESIAVIINGLVLLSESMLEDLKILQCVLALATSTTHLHADSLAAGILLCFKLHFTRESPTLAIAAATIQQIVVMVFERVLAQEGSHSGTMHACATDAYLILQDLCHTIAGESPVYLTSGDLYINIQSDGNSVLQVPAA